MITWTPIRHINELAKNTTHIWRVKLTEQLINITYFQSLLNADEITLAQSYFFRKNSHCSIISRACLRILLGNYLKCDPSSIILHKNKHGKLFLSAEPDFFFNVSHTDEFILYAFTKMAPIGIDIEDTRRDIKFLDVARLFFAKGEMEKLNRLSENDLRSAFFRVWTKKEAFIKAVGNGMSFPLKQFEVTALMEESPCILSINQKTQHNWLLQSFIPEIGYQAAFSQKNNIGQVCYFSFI